MVFFFSTKIKDQLNPAERNLDDAANMIKPMTNQLGELKDLLNNVRQKAQGARDKSETAERAAAAGSEVRGNLWQVSTIK